MNLMSLPLFFGLLLLLPSALQAEEPQEFIEMLNQDLTLSKTDAEKSTLHIYRARQYFKIKEWEKAEEDYNKALELNHKGWIHLERSHFFMTRREYALAYEDARAAKIEVPTLSHEADKIIEVAGAEILKQYEAENPITIVMDGKVDPNRKTRFDVMKTQEIPAAKARKNDNAKQQRTASRKTQVAASQPPQKARG
ncbi:MAG: tetratricopeptide repeat protein [Desulfocapsa sp.]|nr:tetratricopeptide repeat protein [Desulfocapsa sp.]